MSQGFESSEGILGESLDVIILNEPEKTVNIPCLKTTFSHMLQYAPRPVNTF